MATIVGLGVEGAILATILIALLSAKELISSAVPNSGRIRLVLNLAIVPLLVFFMLQVIEAVLV